MYPYISCNAVLILINYKLCDLTLIHVEDSGYTFSTGMIGGAIVVAVLLLIILICAVGCCIIRARRKKIYPMSSVYYSNVKSVDNFEGSLHELVWFKYHRLVSCFY